MAVGWTGPELYPKRLRQRASLVLTSGAAGKVTLLRAVCGVDCPTAGITPRVAASVRVTGGVVRGCARSGDDRDSPASATDSLARRRAVLKLLRASELPEGSAKGTGLVPRLLILGRPALPTRVAAAAGSGTTLKTTDSGSDA